jgi:DNA-binding transcriptional regulator YiaG
MWSSEAVTRELVVALRGARSQTALSRRLGYRTNVVYLWESGRRAPTGAAFLWLAHKVGVDVRGVLRGFASDDPGLEPWRPDALAAWLDRLRGRRSVADLARTLGRDRHAVRRWLGGETEPRLPELLELVEVCTTRGLDLVAEFADPAGLDSVAEPWRQLEAARRSARELPWTPAVLLALELGAYRALTAHEDGWIARRLALSVDDERACLDALAGAGQIRWDGARWEPVSVQAVDTRTPERRSDTKRFWAGVARDRLGSGLSSWNLFSVSEDDLARIQELQRQHYRAIRAIAVASPAAERLVLANQQLVALDEPPEP